MAVRHTSNRNSDGSMIGQDATDKVGFFGITPVAQPVLAADANVAAVVAALTLLGLVRNT